MDTRQAITNFSAGSLATGMSTLLGYPFDTLKARSQCNFKQFSNFKAGRQRGTNIGRNYFKGVRYPLLSVVPKRGIQLMVFETLLTQETNRWEAGMLCGILAIPFNVPIHNLKTCSQVGKILPPRYSLYKGLRTQCIRDMGFGMVYLGSYDWLRKKNISPAIAGCLSGSLVWTVCLPLDSLLTAVQTNSSNYRSFGGWKYMMARSFFVNGSMWFLYEKIRKF